MMTTIKRTALALVMLFALSACHPWVPVFEIEPQRPLSPEVPCITDSCGESDKPTPEFEEPIRRQ